MVNLKFQKVGDVATVKDKMTVSRSIPIPVEGYLGQLLDAIAGERKESREEAEQELRRVVEEAQKVNMDWVTGRFEELHKDPDYRPVDTLLVREDGRIATGWSSFMSYLQYPKRRLPPNIGELLDMVVEREILLYPLVSRRSIWMFCRSENFPSVLDIVNGDIEHFPYDPTGEYTLGYIPDGKLTPSKAKGVGLVVGDLGFWAISEMYIDIDHGDPDKVIDYKPRVYMGRNRHPAATFVYITPNLRSKTIATGHLPMDERLEDSIRVEMDPAEPDVIRSIFSGYQKRDEVNGIPLVLRHRRYTPWTGFYPQHGGSKTQQ